MYYNSIQEYLTNNNVPSFITDMLLFSTCCGSGSLVLRIVTLCLLVGHGGLHSGTLSVPQWKRHKVVLILELH